jgi:hypothetical protein
LETAKTDYDFFILLLSSQYPVGIKKRKLKLPFICKGKVSFRTQNNMIHNR